MKINDILKILEEYAPLNLSNEFVNTYNAYDNSGIIVGVEKEITGILFCLDLTKESINMAKDNNCNLIITHHPAIYKPISKISVEDEIYLAIKNEIGVISFHLNLDTAKLGIDHYLSLGLGAKSSRILEPLKEENTGYGRLFSVDTTVKELVEKIKKEFNTERVLSYGKDKKISKVASFCGAGFNYYELELSSGADLIVSADIPHHIILETLKQKKNIITITHYASELYGFKKFANNIKNKVNEINCCFYEDKNLF